MKILPIVGLLLAGRTINFLYVASFFVSFNFIFLVVFFFLWFYASFGCFGRC